MTCFSSLRLARSRGNRENHLNAAVPGSFRDIVQKAERKAGRTAEREVVRV